MEKLVTGERDIELVVTSGWGGVLVLASPRQEPEPHVCPFLHFPNLLSIIVSYSHLTDILVCHLPSLFSKVRLKL